MVLAPASQISDCACRDGNTPLHLACQCNQLSAIEVLLQWGARAEMTNASGFAPVSHSSACHRRGTGRHGMNRSPVCRDLRSQQRMKGLRGMPLHSELQSHRLTSAVPWHRKAWPSMH